MWWKFWKSTFSSIENKYEDVMDGKLGSFSCVQQLKIRDDAKPVVMSDKRPAISVRPKLKAELDRLVDLGVIIPVEQPTPWVS